MNRKIIDGIRVLAPDEGMRLIKLKDRIITNVVWLGKEARASEWQEITQAEADKLQAQWNAEAEAGVTE